MSVSPLIRPASVQDAAAIGELADSLAGYFLEDPDRPELADDFFNSISVAVLQERLADTRYRFLVAEKGTRIVGVAAMLNSRHLYHLLVRREWHGRGLGKRLWEAILQDAMSAEGEPVFTVNSSLYAVPVYERFGFVVNGEAKRESGLVFVPMVLNAGQA
jgi:GNAT superfamily N-acetyltransferase